MDKIILAYGPGNRKKRYARPTFDGSGFALAMAEEICYNQ